MGSATARAVAAAGHDVTLVEQFSIGHKRGSSHGTARIFRLSYPEPRYVEMAIEALPLWRELEEESGVPILTTTGGLDGGKALEDHVHALETCGAGFELIDATEAGLRWPALRLPEGRDFLFQADGGIVAADGAVAAFAAGAGARGALILEDTKVVSLQQKTNHVTIHLAGGDELQASRVIVTAGPWARPLLATAGIELDVRPTRETVAYFVLDEPTPTLVDWGTPTIYALPDGSGLKVGEHVAGPEADPDRGGEDDVDHASVARLSAWVGEIFAAADAVPRRAETCFYTNTGDQSFVLERHGDIVVGSPCSGHGFKFAPVIGRRLAALATS